MPTPEFVDLDTAIGRIRANFVARLERKFPKNDQVAARSQPPLPQPRNLEPAPKIPTSSQGASSPVQPIFPAKQGSSFESAIEASSIRSTPLETVRHVISPTDAQPTPGVPPEVQRSIGLFRRMIGRIWRR